MNALHINKAEDTFFWASRNCLYHRCEVCWTSQVLITHDGKLMPAVDNGFVPYDQKYPHATWCEHRQDF